MSETVIPEVVTPAMLIFDWDGTLCDSLHRIAYCLQLAADDVGLPVPTVEEAKDIIGLGLYEALAQLFPGIENGAIQVLRNSYAEHFRRVDQTPSPLFADVERTLIDLRDQGYVLTVATGKSRAGLDRVLQAMGMKNFFHSTRCADETASKPDPLMLQSLLEEHGLPAQQAIMVGDTTFDMEMAQRAGVPRIAVSYGAHSLERLAMYDPLACIDAFSVFKKILKTIR